MMNEDLWTRIEKAFALISDLPPSERQTALDSLAQTDPEILPELSSLLAEDEKPHGLFAQSALSAEEENQIGKRIQSYKLVKELEKGGMGTVFLAERVEDGFEQQVALKLARTDRNAEALQRHFERERKILARLQHRNIAALYDGGLSEEGQPFFTMEYVEGEPLNRYCASHQLAVRERLGLFLQVCEAVAYAHQQLIVHLDLKPGNILVKNNGEIKLLDFGLARKEDEKMPGAGNRLTLAYASPEQLNRESLSTRSDVYSLGVILFELLSNQLPRYTEDRHRQAWQKVSEQDIPSIAGFAPSASLRLTEKNELDLICQKALATQEGERYQSVQDLLTDVKAFLEERPISLKARDQSYRLQKYLRRNRTQVAIAVVGLLLLVGTIGTYTYRLTEQRNFARKEALKAQRMVSLMRSVFVEANPDIDPGELKAGELLDEALARLPEELKAEPLLLAEMNRLMSETYLGLGRLARADSLAGASLRQFEELLPPPHAELALSLIQLGQVQYSRDAYEAADTTLRAGIDMLKALRPASDSLLLKHSNSLAHVIFDNGDVEAADSIYRWVYAQHLTQLEAPHPKLADDLHNLGAAAYNLSRFEEADSLLLLSLAMKGQVYQAPHSEIAYTLNQMGSLYRRMGRNEEALALIKDALGQQIAIFGRTHEQVFSTQSNLARLYSSLEYFDSSMVEIDTARAMAERLYGTKNSFAYGMMTYGMGHVTSLLGDLPRARDLHLQALDIYAEVLPPDHVNNYAVLRGLGEIYRKMGQYRESEKAFLRSLDLSARFNGEKHDDTAYILELMGRMYLQAGQKTKARSNLERAYEIYAQWPQRNEELLAELDSTLTQIKVGNSQ
jgi:tetratricopeptide (TPR) repeat protein/predicted Ser/Thr protein kinase